MSSITSPPISCQDKIKDPSQLIQSSLETQPKSENSSISVASEEGNCKSMKDAIIFNNSKSNNEISFGAKSISTSSSCIAGGGGHGHTCVSRTSSISSSGISSSYGSSSFCHTHPLSSGSDLSGKSEEDSSSDDVGDDAEESIDMDISKRRSNNKNPCYQYCQDECSICGGFYDLQAQQQVIQKLTRYSNGSIKLRNPHINFMDQDILYHLALGSESHDLVEMFSDVKFVCIGGTPKRMEEFAYYIMGEIEHKIPTGTQLLDISQHSYRYSMYKTGPVLSISHGMGIPSVSILLHEVIKLMYHAKAKDPVFFRIGTCGGIGIEGGNVIITEEALNADLKPYHELTVLGRKIRRNSKLDKSLCDELMALANSQDDPYSTNMGKTMCTDDFYEGQGRLDGAFCDFSEKEKMSYIHHLHRSGVTNIEMESLAFAALTHHAGIRAAVVCVSIVDRMMGDQVLAPKEVLNEWQMRPQKLVANYIKKHLGLYDENASKSPKMCDLTPPCPCPHKVVLRVKSPRRMNMVQQESQSYD